MMNSNHQEKSYKKVEVLPFMILLSQEVLRIEWPDNRPL